MKRLQKGEQVLGLPPTDKEQLWREACRVSENATFGVVKLILTRGSGGRGYRPPKPCQPRRILSFHPWPDYPRAWYDQGITLRLCKTRLSRQSQLAGIKHLNRLEQVLARAEWDDPSIAEGVMLDEAGEVISGTQSNLFLLKGEELMTADLRHSGIAGVVRELVLESAAEFTLRVRIKRICVDDLKQADALFVTNSILGLCPVGRFEERQYDQNRIPSGLKYHIENTYCAES
jgi:4-amino-4-deoxychorismate lyase